MANDFIPGPDGDFHIRQNTFVTYVNAHLADLGLAAGDVAAVNTAQATWTTAYPAHTDAQNAARAARQAKDGARDGLEGAIRPLVRRLQASPDVDDTERAAMGITVPDREGSPPADPKELTFLAVDTRTPYTTDFEGADAGKTAHYMLRWVSTTGEKGPWSETASATVGA